jgi:hypothetical protein
MSSGLLSQIVPDLLETIRSIRLEADLVSKITRIQLDDLLPRMAMDDIKQVVEALTGRIVSLNDSSIVQQHLREIDSMDLEEDGFLIPTDKARSRVLEMSALSSATFGNALGEAAQPWTMSPLDNGGLLPEWRGPRGDFEVHIGPDGQMAYVLITKCDDSREYESGRLGSSKEILRLISLIFEA